MSQATYIDGYLSMQTKATLMSPVKLRNGEPNSENYSLGLRVGQIQISTGKNEQTVTALHHRDFTYKAATAYLFIVPECKASITFASN